MRDVCLQECCKSETAMLIVNFPSLMCDYIRPLGILSSILNLATHF